MRKEAVMSNFDEKHPGKLSRENVSRLNDNIKIDLREMGCGGGINVQWRALSLVVFDLQVLLRENYIVIVNQDKSVTVCTFLEEL
jgi:hypothetical protein